MSLVTPFYTPDLALRKQEEQGWAMKEDAGRGWRRVVPSPQPLRVVEAVIDKDVTASVLARVTAAEAEAYAAAGHFKSGSMKPKIEAVEGASGTQICP